MLYALHIYFGLICNILVWNLSFSANSCSPQYFKNTVFKFFRDKEDNKICLPNSVFILGKYYIHKCKYVNYKPVLHISIFKN